MFAVIGASVSPPIRQEVDRGAAECDFPLAVAALQAIDIAPFEGDASILAAPVFKEQGAPKGICDKNDVSYQR